mmetsp:Transcript_31614/g.50861  ORF Transcript_31614/g.50861 Transcript_31614/m.50861 type:complete len:254 (-) Transcript_31614:1620-2381(-)
MGHVVNDFLHGSKARHTHHKVGFLLLVGFRQGLHCSVDFGRNTGDFIDKLLHLLEISDVLAADSPPLAQHAANACLLQGHVQVQDGLHHVDEIFICFDLPHRPQNHSKCGSLLGTALRVQQRQKPLIGPLMEAGDHCSRAVVACPKFSLPQTLFELRCQLKLLIGVHVPAASVIGALVLVVLSEPFCFSQNVVQVALLDLGKGVEGFDLVQVHVHGFAALLQKLVAEDIQGGQASRNATPSVPLQEVPFHSWL